MTLRQRLARRLRYLADRLDDDGAMLDTGMSVTTTVDLYAAQPGGGVVTWYGRP